MCDCFLFFGSCKPQLNFQTDRQKPLLIIKDSDYDPAAAAGVQLHNPTAAMALILTSWLNGHRLRYLILFLCSPLLIPIVCATFPFLCAAEVCFRLCRRRRFKSAAPRPPPPPPMSRREDDVEGGRQVKNEFSLLNRYLDDQLELALEILHECGGELGYDYDYMEDFDGDRSNMLC
ncbi:hypothetical protein L6452_12960 [Arctium lappa]|uniref:Uncharacterized protein n=1 Tax=Arctium lappa TaxID=4217 RepID=A0ACB9CGT9_ARCLA|nr:hypothetical protein L6452_12960 [Arctium lappa]